MSLKYLNLTGLSRVITNLKNWVVSQIPTKTSEITNDSGFLTSHQSLDGKMTRGPYERIEGSSSSHKDLNNYITAGFYVVKTAYTDNCPTGIERDAVLLVYQWSSGSYCTQELTESAASTHSRRWIRKLNSTTWSDWVAVAFHGDNLSAFNNDSGFITSSSLPTNYVTTDTTQTIPGQKTFTTDTYITSNSNKYLQIKNTSWDLGQATPSSDKEFGGICFKDKDNQNASYIITYEYASGYGALRLLYRTKFSNGEKSTSGSNVDSQFTIGIMPDGKVYCGTNGYWHTNLIPTVNNNITLGNSTYRWKAIYSNAYYLGSTAFGDIVTHNASEFLTEHQSLSNYVTTNTAQTIDGAKTFVDSVSIKRSNPFLQIRTTGYVKGVAPLDNYYQGVRFYDDESSNSENHIVGGFETQYITSGYNISNINCRNYDQNNVHLNYSVGLYVPNDSTKPIQFVPSVNNVINLGSSSNVWKSVYANSYYLGTTAFGDIVTHNTSEFLTSHQAVSNSAPTLSWGTTSTIGTIGGTALTVKMPANPNTNTTYSAGTGLSLSGTTFSLALTKALVTDALGYTPPTTDTNTDTKVTQTVTTGNSWYPIILGNTADATATETSGARFAKGARINTRYGQLALNNTYDSNCLIGGTGTEYIAGRINIGDYTKHNAADIRCYRYSSGRVGFIFRVYNRLTDGAYATDGTEVSGYLRLNYDTSGKYIDTDLAWNDDLLPLTTNSKTIGNSSLYWKGAYVITQYMGGDIVFNGTHNLRSNVDNSYVRIQGGSGEGNGSRIILSGKTRSGLQGYAEIVATDGSNTNTFTVKPNGETLVNGNNLAATIIKGLSVNGKTITYTKIDGSTGTITTQDTVYTHPTTAGNKHIPSGGSSGQILKYSSSGTAAWADPKFTREMTQIATRTTVGNGTWTITSVTNQLMVVHLYVEGTSATTTHLVNITLIDGAYPLVPDNINLIALSSSSATIQYNYYVLLWATGTSVKIKIANVTSLSTLNFTAYQ